MWYYKTYPHTSQSTKLIALVEDVLCYVNRMDLKYSETNKQIDNKYSLH